MAKGTAARKRGAKPEAKAGPRSSAGRRAGLPRSRRGWMALGVLVAAAAGFLAWQSGEIWRQLGYGVILATSAALAVGWAAAMRPNLVTQYWNRWAGALVLGCIAWAFLGFFNGPGLLHDASLGGQVGRRLLGGRDALGGLRLAGYGLVATALLAPVATRDAAVMASRKLAAAFRSAAPVWADALRSWARWVRGATVRFWRRLAERPPARTQPDAVDGSGPVEAPRLPPAPSGRALPPAERGEEEAEEAEEPLETPGLKAPRAASRQDKERPVLLQQPRRSDGWRLPAIEILDHVPADAPRQTDNEARARLIEQALSSYGIEASVVEINPGPAVTQFGVEPGWVRKFKEVKVRDAEGKHAVDDEGKPVTRKEEVSRTRVKVDAIANLDKDLALALAAPSIRIEAPIPGKSMVGIEVPNAQAEVVSLRHILESPTFIKLLGKSKVAIALGKGSGGEPWVADLARMPHVLIAGATGSGKSVCINAILACILMNTTPTEVRLLLVDPKRVELVPFNSVPHLVAPVIVDVEKVVSALKWAMKEMDERYKRFAAVSARNIEAYNKSRLVNEPLPYLVIAIDELADLMMAAPYDVEYSLTRLAQLGRATGIHLVVATQRPSVDVVTGLIKANFPTRVSFAVSSLVDSRTILDTPGAEKLLGKGDMLYLPQDAPKPLRIQGVFVSDREIERIVRAWNTQSPPFKPARVTFDAPEPPPAGPSSPAAPAPPASATQGDDDDADPLLKQAREIAQQSTRVSASLLSRRLKIGYTKAKRLMEELEAEGYADSEREMAL